MFGSKETKSNPDPETLFVLNKRSNDLDEAMHAITTSLANNMPDVYRAEAQFAKPQQPVNRAAIAEAAISEAYSAAAVAQPEQVRTPKPADTTNPAAQAEAGLTADSARARLDQIYAAESDQSNYGLAA